ncbi:nitrilase-related carbon-nitrogen hydrolase [Streptomyces virginiae]|uniref:nitrilase-related carbon-nitrogen hydrolase n=1 Tax=Streptomyces virginiae TaxID=1961 RepID=UPI001D40F488|nr:nitrilase-related carbon-nitrogen hydrolase [Streptomyces virginiae]MBP2342393.1 N-carbamoylputrescine amidase [Streptomyces virginiae]
MTSYALLTSYDSPLGSPGRTRPAEREPLRVGLIQMRWYADPAEHDDRLREGVALAAAQGAQVVCLPELTRSPYFCNTDDPMADGAERWLEDVETGPTVGLATELATGLGITVHASLYERAGDGGLGYNTAVCVDADGRLLARTRKNHIPAFPGYREDLCFRPGDSGFPVVAHAGARLGFPTCWDEWFPELARAYSLAGAEILVHPTAIGSEVDLPDFDTRPMWEHAISANGLANALFMIVPNRVGTEGRSTFYGSSFISDPYGRVMLRAPRDTPAVLVADLDLDQRRDWLDFGLMHTRRPELYGTLTERPGRRF